jgi:hypothetical protein
VQAVIGNPYLSLGAMAVVALVGIPVALRLPSGASTQAEVGAR